MVWGILWSSFSQPEMTTILFTLLSYWNKSRSLEATYWQTALMVRKLSGNISQSVGPSYVIPPQKNVSQPWPIDWHLYKERHLIECFFQKIKWFRRVATRYDKLDVSFLAFVYLAAIAILVL